MLTIVRKNFVTLRQAILLLINADRLPMTIILNFRQFIIFLLREVTLIIGGRFE